VAAPANSAAPVAAPAANDPNEDLLKIYMKPAQGVVVPTAMAPASGAPGSFPATVPQPLPVTPSVPVNVTGTFFPGVGLVYSTQGVFSPPGTTAGGGDGYPIRYWKVRIDFSYFWPGLLPSTPPDALNLQATYY
jgi:hypothetical protein